MTSFSAILSDARRVLETLAGQQAIFDQIAVTATGTLKQGGKILTCGNGGSAADAMHLAEELVGRYSKDRRSLPAICLNADPTLLTCIGNDYGFEFIFSRQLEGLAGKGDLLIVFTSSGNSANILRALDTARQRGVKSVALLGKDGGACKGKADIELIVRSPATARIQEAHTVILHALLEVIEAEIAAGKL